MHSKYTPVPCNTGQMFHPTQTSQDINCKTTSFAHIGSDNRLANPVAKLFDTLTVSTDPKWPVKALIAMTTLCLNALFPCFGTPCFWKIVIMVWKTTILATVNSNTWSQSVITQQCKKKKKPQRSLNHYLAFSKSAHLCYPCFSDTYALK